MNRIFFYRHLNCLEFFLLDFDFLKNLLTMQFIGDFCAELMKFRTHFLNYKFLRCEIIFRGGLETLNFMLDGFGIDLFPELVYR
jgi:hypothetical protein